MRHLKGLEDIIDYTSVHWHMLEKGELVSLSRGSLSLTTRTGWRFAEPNEDVSGKNTTPDPIHKNYTHLQDIYFQVNPDYDGRFTVPTLYDKKTNQIVNNESSEIIRMLYTAFDDVVDDKYKKIDLFPQDLREKIEGSNDWTYNDINNGVYKSGFATYAIVQICTKRFIRC